MTEPHSTPIGLDDLLDQVKILFSEGQRSSDTTMHAQNGAVNQSSAQVSLLQLGRSSPLDQNRSQHASAARHPDHLDRDRLVDWARTKIEHPELQKVVNACRVSGHDAEFFSVQTENGDSGLRVGSWSVVDGNGELRYSKRVLWEEGSRAHFHRTSGLSFKKIIEKIDKVVTIERLRDDLHKMAREDYDVLIFHACTGDLKSAGIDLQDPAWAEFKSKLVDLVELPAMRALLRLNSTDPPHSLKDAGYSLLGVEFQERSVLKVRFGREMKTMSQRPDGAIVEGVLKRVDGSHDDRRDAWVTVMCGMLVGYEVMEAVRVQQAARQAVPRSKKVSQTAIPRPIEVISSTSTSDAVEVSLKIPAPVPGPSQPWAKREAPGQPRSSVSIPLFNVDHTQRRSEVDPKHNVVSRPLLDPLSHDPAQFERSSRGMQVLESTSTLNSKNPFRSVHKRVQFEIPAASAQEAAPKPTTSKDLAQARAQPAVRSTASTTSLDVKYPAQATAASGATSTRVSPSQLSGLSAHADQTIILFDPPGKDWPGLNRGVKVPLECKFSLSGQSIVLVGGLTDPIKYWMIIDALYREYPRARVSQICVNRLYMRFRLVAETFDHNGQTLDLNDVADWLNLVGRDRDHALYQSDVLRFHPDERAHHCFVSTSGNIWEDEWVNFGYAVLIRQIELHRCHENVRTQNSLGEQIRKLVHIGGTAPHRHPLSSNSPAKKLIIQRGTLERFRAVHRSGLDWEEPWNKNRIYPFPRSAYSPPRGPRSGIVSAYTGMVQRLKEAMRESRIVGSRWLEEKTKNNQRKPLAPYNPMLGGTAYVYTVGADLDYEYGPSIPGFELLVSLACMRPPSQLPAPGVPFPKDYKVLSTIGHISISAEPHRRLDEEWHQFDLPPGASSWIEVIGPAFRGSSAEISDAWMKNMDQWESGGRIGPKPKVPDFVASSGTRKWERTRSHVKKYKDHPRFRPTAEWLAGQYRKVLSDPSIAPEHRTLWRVRYESAGLDKL